MDTIGGPNATTCKRVIGSAATLLMECERFVEHVPDEVFRSDSTVLRGGTIGKHVRHALDHFSAVLAGLDGHTVIDYDRRERGVTMESDRSAAAAEIRQVREQIASLTEGVSARQVRVRVMTGGDGGEAELGSTFGRELAFATHHAVHHQAMMKAIAQEFGVIVGADFGKAPSTINYERRR